jgi:hypothetical protein
VLCVKETWIAAGATVPAITGYRVVEQWLQIGTYGGLATYYRQLFQLENRNGNEYGLYTKLILPTSERLNIVNVYLPPTSLLACRDITEIQATNQLELVMETIQPQLLMVMYGNFNARIGYHTPLLDHDHSPRYATYTHICPQATWFL